jgi:SAM-dependent methyltransferase
LESLLADPEQPYVDTITVSESEHLVLPPRRDNGYGNHACDPSLWWTGRYELAARRDIGAGEEVTNDYGTSTGEPGFAMACDCGSALCRYTVTGDDWRRPELRERYGRHWVPALLDRIRRDVNRANWDTWASVHGQDGYYDRAGLIAGADSLIDLEWDGIRAAVGAVDGLDVLHVQCHLGFDAVTLSRHGARVTGVDFSPVALAKAAALAEDAGVTLDLVEADVTDLPPALTGRFDLAYATIGILCWIDDVDAWMRSVARTLRPGGRLLLIDGHPFARMIEQTDPLTLSFPYANDGPHTLRSDGSYAGAAESTTHIQYAHSIGEIITAAVGAGLRIAQLTEHLDAPLPGPGTGGDRSADGRYRVRVTGRPVPLYFTLIATRPLE